MDKIDCATLFAKYAEHKYNSYVFSTSVFLACFMTQDEILEVAGKIYKAGMSLLVIDTENKFVSTGFAKEIARVAQGLLLNYSLYNK